MNLSLFMRASYNRWSLFLNIIAMNNFIILGEKIKFKLTKCGSMDLI